MKQKPYRSPNAITPTPEEFCDYCKQASTRRITPSSITFASGCDCAMCQRRICDDCHLRNTSDEVARRWWKQQCSRTEVLSIGALELVQARYKPKEIAKLFDLTRVPSQQEQMVITANGEPFTLRSHRTMFDKRFWDGVTLVAKAGGYMRRSAAK